MLHDACFVIVHEPHVARGFPRNLVAVDPPAKSFTFLGFRGKHLDFPKK